PSAYFSLNVTSTALSARKEPARQQRSRTSKYSMSPQTAREPSFAPHPAKPPPVLLAPSDRATASGCRHSSSRQWPQEACRSQDSRISPRESTDEYVPAGSLGFCLLFPGRGQDLGACTHTTAAPP